MAKSNQNSIIEPTPEELVIYQDLIQGIPDFQMDDLAQEYYEEVSQKGLNISFPRYLINKMVRPIKPADTITVEVEGGKNVNLFCLVRETINEVDYLLFAEADPDTEELKTEVTYLFYVVGKDEVGTETIDILPNCQETEEILDILEELYVKENPSSDSEESQSGQS